MQTVTKDNWGKVTEKATAILQFSAPWCGPCKNQSKVLDEVAGEHASAFFGKVDVEESSDLADSFHVQSVPTIVIIKNGIEESRLVGFQTREKLEYALSF